MFKIKSISKYFFSIFNLSLDKLRNSYFKTSFYNQKISKEIPSKYITFQLDFSEPSVIAWSAVKLFGIEGILK